jgi:hypothetical protein
MLKDIVYVQPLDGYCLRLGFEDGVEGVVDVSRLVEFSGVFAPLATRAFFTQARANPETGTVEWPNQADLDPDVLYALVSGEPLPDFESAVAEAA